MRRILLLTLAAVAVVVPARPAAASCAAPIEGDIVFEGRSAGRVETDFEGPEGATPFAFDVERSVEGGVGDRVVVWMSVPQSQTLDDGTELVLDSSIGVDPPQQGERYRVSADRSGDPDSLNALLVNACTGGLELLAGPGPEPANPGNAGLLAPLVGAGGLLLLLVVAALAQRDRSPDTSSQTVT